jgi:hypothetical protein
MEAAMIDVTKYTRNQSPGKFEGEPAETEYFYEQMMNGDGETIYASNDSDSEDEYGSDTPCAELFQIDAYESEAFDLPIGRWFLLVEDSQGFVFGSVHETRDKAESAFNKWAGV